MTSGPIVALELMAHDAIKKWRNLLGKFQTVDLLKMITRFDVNLDQLTYLQAF